MIEHVDLTASALRAPEDLGNWPDFKLTMLLQHARRAGLLGRIDPQTRSMGSGALGSSVCAPLQPHLQAYRRVCQAQQAEIRREVRFLDHALRGLDSPVVLLKGAAYVMAELPAARGRMFGDIDILVARSTLDEAEHRLAIAGWRTQNADLYDQRYYRRWMHELPPMEHIHRGTALDVHHSIVPLTARLKPNPAPMLQRAIPVPGFANIRVLAPEDMVLHSMTHLFLNDDTSYALRDLSDLDLLMRHFSDTVDDFWRLLLSTADEQDLRRPLYYGLRHTRRALHSPIPDWVIRAAERYAPALWQRPLMDAIWQRALRSPHPGAALAGTALAQAALYLRGHYLRMPLPMLTRHLSVKAWKRLTSSAPAAATG